MDSNPKVRWLYQRAGETEWHELRNPSRMYLSRAWNLQGSNYAGQLYTTPWNNASGRSESFPPFTASSTEHSENIFVDFPAMTLKITNPPMEASLKRVNTFAISLERAAIDRNAKIPSLPRFLHPFGGHDLKYDRERRLATHKEVLMIQLSAQIREKEDWEKKYKDTSILNKWRNEATKLQVDADMFGYVISELSYYDLQSVLGFNETLMAYTLTPSTIDGVWQSDGLVEESLRKELLNEVEKLEKVPERDKDWHPGSNNQVLNLVHPSMYCFVAGFTRQTEKPIVSPIASIGSGEVKITNFATTKVQTVILENGDKTYHNSKDTPNSAQKINKSNKRGGYNPKAPKPPKKIMEDPLLGDVFEREMDASEKDTSSKTYQWLPADFSVSEEGQVKWLSYINNLDPRKHKPLYDILGHILETFIPLWEKVLTDLLNPRPPRYAPDTGTWYRKHGQQVSDHYKATYAPPEVGFFEYPPEPTNVVTLNGRTLQVIVKLANIILTPEKPQYAGGVWHVEGMNNERIVSSGIYYYDSENISNISESRLDFRIAVGPPSYNQDDRKGVKKMYNFQDGDPLNQVLGSLITKSGRSIAFPNLYQHLVRPFGLIDPTKPGHRKILVFFLVDPSQMVLSTRFVPPQQVCETVNEERELKASWLLDTLAHYRPFSTLPHHILSMIVDYTTSMSKERAEKEREELMKERKFFVKSNSEKVFERPFSLCEH